MEEAKQIVKCDEAVPAELSCLSTTDLHGTAARQLTHVGKLCTTKAQELKGVGRVRPLERPLLNSGLQRSAGHR